MRLIATLAIIATILTGCDTAAGGTPVRPIYYQCVDQ